MQSRRVEKSCRPLIASLLVIVALVVDAQTSSAFPSLFSRTPFVFRHQQQQQQQQQQVAQSSSPALQQQQNQERLVPIAASSQGQLTALPMQLQQRDNGNFMQFRDQQAAAELMRLAAGHPSQAHMALGALQAAPARVHAQHQFVGAQPNTQHHYASGFYHSSKPATVAAAHNQNYATGHGQSMGSTHESIDEPQLELIDHSAASSPVENSLNQRHQLKQSALANAGQLHLEPTHTSEIVDKIEQHIGQQIEQGLNDEQPTKQLYQQQQQQSGREKTAAASDESASSEPESPESDEASSEGGSEAEKPEKRHSAEESHHSKHEEHHHEQPPEAFEVHHKKGGKSFQYFHQGHSHP